MIKGMVTEYYIMAMVTNMRESGKTIDAMVWE